MTTPRNHGPNYFAVVELRGQGLSQEQIARRLGISLSRVRKILKANGLTGSGVPRRQAK
jgi:transcriptional regulator with XRE-family HTH domain